MTELTDAELAGIEERLHKATPGPWELDAEDGSISADDGCVAHIQHHGNVNTVQRTGEHYSHDDGNFISHSITDIARLLADLKAARERIVELERERDESPCWRQYPNAVGYWVRKAGYFGDILESTYADAEIVADGPDYWDMGGPYYGPIPDVPS